MNILSNIVWHVQNQLKSPQREIDQLSDFDLYSFSEFIEAQNGIVALSNFLTWFLWLENNCLLCRRKARP